MVMQVATDSGEVVRRRDAGCTKLTRIADSRARENRGRAVGSRGHDHAPGFDSDRTVASRYDDCTHSSRFYFKAVARRVADDRQVRSLADRVEIGERRVPADAVRDIGRTRRHAEVLVEIVKVSDAWDSRLGRGVQ